MSGILLHRLSHQVLDAIGQPDRDSIPRASTFRYTENGRELDLEAGLFASGRAVRYRCVIADAESEQAAFFAVVEEGEELVVLGVRMRAEGARISELECVVARKGEASVFAPERLQHAERFYDERVAPALRSSREQLCAIADRYFDGIERDSSADVPFHASCKRVENGARTTDNPDFLGGMGCREQLDRKVFSYIDKVRARRYPVLDEERGLACAVVFLDVPGTVTSIELDGQTIELPERMRVPRSVLLFEVFKVSGAEIHEIEAFMVNLPYAAESGWAASA